MFEYGDAYLLEVGNNKISVLNLMGSPSFKSQLEDDSWFYFQEQTESFLFFKPKVVKREILVIDFIGQNISEISRYNLENERKNFHFSKNFTEVVEHKTGFLKSLFSNIGRVGAQ
jgi:outer membrane protein assembly factor BamE (lipoprotein component of BamABCDE complex)